MDSKPIRERQIMPVVSRCCRDRLSDFAVTSVPPNTAASRPPQFATLQCTRRLACARRPTVCARPSMRESVDEEEFDSQDLVDCRRKATRRWIGATEDLIDLAYAVTQLVLGHCLEFRHDGRPRQLGSRRRLQRHGHVWCLHLSESVTRLQFPATRLDSYEQDDQDDCNEPRQDVPIRMRKSPSRATSDSEPNPRGALVRAKQARSNVSRTLTSNSPLPLAGRGVAGNHHVTGLLTLDAARSVPCPLG